MPGWFDYLRGLLGWWSVPPAAPVSEPADEYWDLRCASGNRSGLLGADNFRADLRGVENVRVGLRGDL